MAKTKTPTKKAAVKKLVKKTYSFKQIYIREDYLTDADKEAIDKIMVLRNERAATKAVVFALHDWHIKVERINTLAEKIKELENKLQGMQDFIRRLDEREALTRELNDANNDIAIKLQEYVKDLPAKYKYQDLIHDDDPDSDWDDDDN